MDLRRSTWGDRNDHPEQIERQPEGCSLAYSARDIDGLSIGQGL
jgi:hypothetical protein